MASPSKTTVRDRCFVADGNRAIAQKGSKMKKRQMKAAIAHGGVFQYTKKLARMLGYDPSKLAEEARFWDAGYDLSQARVVVRGEQEWKSLAPVRRWSNRMIIRTAEFDRKMRETEEQEGLPAMRDALYFLNFTEDRCAVRSAVRVGWRTLFTQGQQGVGYQIAMDY